MSRYLSSGSDRANHRFPYLTRRVVIVVGLLAYAVAGCVQESPPSSVDQTVSMLVGLLQDEQVEVRRTAVESLGKIGDPAAIAKLIPLTEDPSPLVRAAAVKALGRLASDGRDTVVSHVVRALKDDQGFVRRAATEALGEMDPPAILLGELPPLLSSVNVEIRRAAVRALWLVDASNRLEVLQLATRDSDAPVRQGAVAAIGELGASAGQATLAERALQDPDAAVRTEAVYQLGRSAQEEGNRVVLQKVAEEDKEEGVRRWARMLRGTD